MKNETNIESDYECNECASLEKEVSRLKAERDKLKSENRSLNQQLTSRTESREEWKDIALKASNEVDKLKSENERLKGWQESALTVLGSWDKVSEWIMDNNKASLGDHYSIKALETLINQESEIKRLNQRIKELEK